jgi:hypothetical protein
MSHFHILKSSNFQINNLGGNITFHLNISTPLYVPIFFFLKKKEKGFPLQSGAGAKFSLFASFNN